MRKSESRVSIRKASKFFAAFIICVFALLTACGEKGSRGYDDSLYRQSGTAKKRGGRAPSILRRTIPKKPEKIVGTGTRMLQYIR